jgi:AcrR family transcriptional regulator
MPEPQPEGTSRLDRRRARTRAALVRAAQSLIAQGRLNVPISDITETADVATGSFYNYFETKEDLFRVAVTEAMESYGDLLDRLTAELDDPAERFCQAVRLSGRLARGQPELARVLLNSGPGLLRLKRGLAPRALRDLQAGAAAGRFTLNDPEIALVVVVGSGVSLIQLLLDQPDRDVDAAAGELAENLLRMFGLPAAEARSLSQRPLPDLDATASESAALGSLPRAVAHVQQQP